MTRIEPGTGALSLTSFPPTVWNAASFASKWYADALREAKLPGLDARRREIVFSACCAESYLLEWVRDGILKGQHGQLEQYFPADRRDGILDRWKDIIKMLAAKKLIPKAQTFGTDVWANFRFVVECRNGLVDGLSSRPDSSSQPKGLRAKPGPQTLEEISQGWSIGIVRSLIGDLHACIGTAPPDWLVVP